MGSSPQPPAPTPPPPSPSAAETTREAIQAQIDATPKILATQQQYGPQFSQLNLEQLQQFGPQFAEEALKLQAKYAPQFKAVEDMLNPELKLASDSLSRYLAGNDQAEFEALKPGLSEDINSQQSIRGLGPVSPLGSIDHAVQLERMRQSLKDRRLNVELTTTGRQPIGMLPTIQGQTGGPGQLVQNVSPGDFMGYQSGVNSNNASIFNTQAGIYGQQLAHPRQDFLGSMLSMGAGSASAYGGAQLGSSFGSTLINPASWSGAGTSIAGFFGCWVASEVFNEPMDGPRVSSARKFITYDCPDWFKRGYIKYGQRIATFIHDKPILKAMIRPLFAWFAKKGAIYGN